MTVSASAPGASCASTLAVNALVIWTPFPHVRTEALSGEGDCVRARPKILDAVLAAAIGANGADLFNQRGALRLDGDVSKGGAGRVMHSTGDRLCECHARNARSPCDENSEHPTRTHEIGTSPLESHASSSELHGFSAVRSISFVITRVVPRGLRGYTAIAPDT
jgi:hypothetical protein